MVTSSTRLYGPSALSNCRLSAVQIYIDLVSDASRRIASAFRRTGFRKTVTGELTDIVSALEGRICTETLSPVTSARLNQLHTGKRYIL
jgi:hypothetical protein